MQSAQQLENDRFHPLNLPRENWLQDFLSKRNLHRYNAAAVMSAFAASGAIRGGIEVGTCEC